MSHALAYNAATQADPADIVLRAHEAHPPVLRTFCLFSGGHDSSVLAHRTLGLYDELAYIDTGTALPGVRDFVETYALWLGKPLRILEAGDAFRRMVLGTPEWWEGFRAYCQANLLATKSARSRREFNEAERLKPGKGLAPQMPIGLLGPAGHGFAYQRLKERQLERLVREARDEFRTGPKRLAERVALLSGVRIDESTRRKMTTAAMGEFERRGNTVWVNPLYAWTNDEMRTYRRERDLPESEVAAMIHRSGECNCGAFASPGEREELMSIYPDWWEATMGPLEQECERLGLPSVWGQRPSGMKRQRGGVLCVGCDQLSLLGEEMAA